MEVLTTNSERMIFDEVHVTFRYGDTRQNDTTLAKPYHFIVIDKPRRPSRRRFGWAARPRRARVITYYVQVPWLDGLTFRAPNISYIMQFVNTVRPLSSILKACGAPANWSKYRDFLFRGVVDIVRYTEPCKVASLIYRALGDIKINTDFFRCIDFTDSEKYENTEMLRMLYALFVTCNEYDEALAYDIAQIVDSKTALQLFQRYTKGERKLVINNRLIILRKKGYNFAKFLQRVLANYYATSHENSVKMPLKFAIPDGLTHIDTPSKLKSLSKTYGWCAYKREYTHALLNGDVFLFNAKDHHLVHYNSSGRLLQAKSSYNRDDVACYYPQTLEALP